jgi:hypothetical protein
MSPSTRRVPLLLVLGLAGACAPTPDAPDAPDVDASVAADAEPVSRCRPGPPAQPGTALTTPAAQPLPAPPPLIGEGPDLVSGSATRVDGALWISFGYRPTAADVTTLRGRLLDENDEPIEALPTDLSALPRSPQYGPGVVQILLDPTAARARTRHVEILVSDRRGVGSYPLRMPVTEGQRRPDGEPCSPDGLFNICREGSACSPANRCAALAAPVLRRAEAFVATAPARSALTLAWDDPNGDVAAIEVTPDGRREPLVIAVEGTSIGGEWSQRWTRDFLDGARRASVRVRDRTGRYSDSLDLVAASPAAADAGAACDPEMIRSQCAAGMVCTRDNGLTCGETRCAADVAACPAGVGTTTLDATADGPWVATGSMAGAGEVRASACDRYVGRALIHRFRAPGAGAYEFALAADDDTWTTRLILRTRCGVSDVGAQEASTSRGGRRVSLPATLAAGQEVFLFVTTEDRFTLSAARVR